MPEEDRAARSALFRGYRPLPEAQDELFDGAGSTRPGVSRVTGLLDRLGTDGFRKRQRLADTAFRTGGITFSVYSDQRGVEKTFPFDLIPRVVSASDWAHIERGLVQRVTALDRFLRDVYGDQRILAAGVVPTEMVLGSRGYRDAMRGVLPDDAVHLHIAGIDLVRDGAGDILVLEDNARVPSGVSYVLENRAVMKRTFPSVFTQANVRAVDDYPVHLRETLLSVSPVDREETQVVVLTPGPYNAAFFEHGFLARRMGCPLVVGPDLFVRDRRVYAKTTRGPRPVHVIYRRIDDDFLDPVAFREDSALGVPGIFEAYRAGNVVLANAIGNGVADDKGIYPFVPEMIRFYLSEEPVLGQVPTYVCARKDDLAYVLEHLGELVVKEVDGAGGYGILMGPTASRAEREAFAAKLRADPRAFIAQPRLELSTCPAWTQGRVGARRVDLRPYVVRGADTWVLPGGLTRVALEEGSFVVNSSQGGGSKDTWVLADEEEGG